MSTTRLLTQRGQLQKMLVVAVAKLRPQPSQILVVLDTRAKQVCMPAVNKALEQCKIHFRILRAPAGEANKTLTSAQSLAERCIQLGADRHSFLLAVGGGVTSDLTGFVAANLFRGIAWGVVPTTLLAMVDAGVGGKTAVNLPAGQNLFGAFHQPRFVLNDVRLLRSLSNRTWNCGMGEVLKTGMLAGPKLWQSIPNRAVAPSRRTGQMVEDWIRQCASFKQKIVRRDASDCGERKQLNLGHTFGHALETLAGPKKLSHGEAVALGLRCAIAMSLEQDLCATDYALQLDEKLKAHGLPLRFPGSLPSPASLRRQLLRDKKKGHGSLELILPIKPGLCILVQGVSATKATNTIHRLLG